MITLLSTFAALALLAAPASAALGNPLARFGDTGVGAGQLNLLQARTGGIAADPDSGHVFVSDPANNRIDVFTAWGEFVESWGWGVRDGSAELQTCTAATTCRSGLMGFGAGQLKIPAGIAVGRTGDVFVFEGHVIAQGSSEGSQRVQVFSAEGEFLRMFGGGVDHTTGADVCTKADLAAGDECGAGEEGAGPSEFSAAANSTMLGDYLDIGPDGTVYVADKGRIQEFGEDGTFEGELTFATVHASNASFPEGLNPGTLSVDPVSGDIYIGFVEQAGGSSLWRITPTGDVVAPAPLLTSEEAAATPINVEAVATDSTGSVFASIVPFQTSGTDIGAPGVPVLAQVPPNGGALTTCCQTKGVEVGVLTTNVVTASGESDVYVMRGANNNWSVEVVGPAPDKWPPPPVPPTIEAQFPADVGQDSADLRATINPDFWQDTNYYLEYGTGECSAGGCPTKVPISPGQGLESGVVKIGVETKPIVLHGLSPDTKYHFRFIAESGGGGPVFGEDPDGGGSEEATFLAGGERAFTTLRAPSAAVGGCGNESFRTGPSAALEDCRAFEMVSPVDKAGGDVLAQCNILCFPARLDQGAPDGEAITYSSYRSFAGAQSSGYTTQYLATRNGGGWSTRGISPPLSAPPVEPTGLDSEYEGFSEDLSSGWLQYDYAGSLAPGAVDGYPNLYRRDNGLDAYEALTTAAPITGNHKTVELQGFSANGKRAVFAAREQLTANAVNNPEIYQLYESFKGTVRLVSVKPSGTASQFNVSAGSFANGGELGNGRGAHLTHAISEEGNRIYWSEEDGEGKLYVRVNGTQTRPVSTGRAGFWASTPSGSQALYTEGGDLRLYNFGAESSTSVAETVVGVLGESEDLSRIYFVATGSLAGKAVAGQPNLFLYEDGRPLTYVATLASSDTASLETPSPFEIAPWRHVAHVNPDGEVAVFMSQASLAGAETIGLNGKAAAEVFRFDATDHQLNCISCSPSGVRASSRQWTGRGTATRNTGYWYASKIPTWEFNLHEVRVVSSNGNRVFFDTVNQLTAADTNHAEDVYSWEAQGTGTCSSSNTDYTVAWGGCVSLISSGTDPADSEFVDSSANGRDAFFVTGASLVTADPGQFDLYDAREGGGFPPEGAAAPGCEGEACQRQAGPPPTWPSASQDFVGPGNLKPKPKKCRKGFIKRKGKCVKKHQGKPKSTNGHYTKGAAKHHKGGEHHGSSSHTKQKNRGRQGS